MTPPFRSTPAAWFWCMRNLNGPRDGIKAICDPEDIVRVIDRLYQQRRLNFSHVRIMRKYGEAQMVPAQGGGDALLWREAMLALDTPLRARGIVSSLEDNVIPFPVKGETRRANASR